LRVHGGRASGSGRRVKRRAAGSQGPGSRASGIWGHGVEGGSGGAKVGGGVKGGSRGTEVGGSIEGGGVEGGGAEVGGSIERSGAEVGSDIVGGGGAVKGGGTEVGQPDGTKPNFNVIRVSCQLGYSPYTRYIFGIS
jgi:hypothetical protein